MLRSVSPIPMWSTVIRDRLVLVVLSASVVVNLALAAQLHRARMALAPLPFLTGNVGPPVRLIDSTGKATILDYGKSNLPTLFYWFSPTCGGVS